MKNKQRKTPHWATAIAVVATVAGVFGAQVALAGIKDTKHNLGTEQTKGVTANEFSGTGEICVFCHTPHAADTATKMPLWNRSASTATFTTYNSLGTLSLDGGTSLSSSSTSMACLSCHDGVTAMNTVINAPGSGKAGNAAWTTGTWTGNFNTDGKMTGLASLGSDTDSLQNDHPVGIQYAGGPKVLNTIPAAPGEYKSEHFRDPDFKTAYSATLSSKQVWWVETGGEGRQKTDLPLYARSDVALKFTDASRDATTSGSQPFVECASCHDPHSSNDTFLRVLNTNSAVCLACHDK
jgi:predicted CXXCH cytochrome family protein